MLEIDNINIVFVMICWLNEQLNRLNAFDYVEFIWSIDIIFFKYLYVFIWSLYRYKLNIWLLGKLLR